MNRVLTRPSFLHRGSWLSHRPEIGARLPKPSFHLFHGHFFRIIDDAVHLGSAPPALLDRKNPGLPFQGSRAHVKSSHDEGGFGRSGWHVSVGAGREPQAQQCDAQDKGKPSHHGLFSFAYNRQENVREAQVRATTRRRSVDCPTRPLQARGLCSKQ